MNLSHIRSFEQLEHYLREFVNWPGEVVPYDSGGVACLLGALLDNIHRHGIESDFDEMKERFTSEQAATLRRIVSHLPT